MDKKVTGKINEIKHNRNKIITTLKCARKVMRTLEENNMSLLVDETNQVYVKNNENGILVCLNDMQDAFSVKVLKEDESPILNTSNKHFKSYNGQDGEVYVEPI